MYLKYKNNQYKFESSPQYINSLSNIHLNVGCRSSINIFDIENCKVLASKSISYPYVLHNKDQVSYLSTNSSLSVVDTRSSTLLQTLFSFSEPNINGWVLHPTRNESALIYENRIDIIDAKKRNMSSV